MVEVELQKALTLLVAANIIFGRGTPPNAIYSFKHALVQDVAYEAALRRTRQQLHARIAATLEEKFPDTAINRPELVAHHYTNAGLAAKAAEFWLKAGRTAAKRSANIEARNQLEKGLELLDAIAEPEERRRRELDLLVALGPPLIALEGFAAEQTVQVYRRIRELSERLGNLPTIFPALYGEWLYHAARAEHRAAQAIAARFAELAEKNQTRGLRVIAHRITGVSHLCLGELDDSRRHLEKLLARYTREAHHELAFRYGTDPAVSALSFLSWVQWLQGDAERAVETRDRAIALARALGHSHSLAHALGIGGCLLDCLRGDADSAQALSDAIIALGREHRFPYWLAAGTAARGWCLMKRGNPGAAVDMLLDAIEQARGATMEEFRPLFLAMLAEAYGASNRPERGLEALDEAVARVEAERGVLDRAGASPPARHSPPARLRRPDRRRSLLPRGRSAGPPPRRQGMGTARGRKPWPDRRVTPAGARAGRLGHHRGIDIGPGRVREGAGAGRLSIARAAVPNRPAAIPANTWAPQPAHTQADGHRVDPLFPEQPDRPAARDGARADGDVVAPSEASRAKTIRALLALERAYPPLWRMLEHQVGQNRGRLSRNEMRILQAIPSPGGALVRELAQDLCIDAGQLSRMLDKLVRRRLVVRSRCEPDGRKKRIVMTGRGRDARAALDRAALRLVDRVVGSLSPNDRQRLIDAAETIGRALALRPPEGQANGRLRLARFCPRP